MKNTIITAILICGAACLTHYIISPLTKTVVEIHHVHTDTIYRRIPSESFDTLTPTNLCREIDRSEVEHPLIVLAQALWETGNLGCDSCSLDRNNIFGFRKDSTHYLYFGTWQECVYYYARWQRRKGYKYGEDYFEFLRRKWGAKDPDAYVNAIRKKVKEIDAFGIYNEKR